ncbi:MAG: hypothetical protein COA32_14225 [Fluviicola sp.]|nr:MAG: hypothetical protein COA32_14225 [Fluviicola sp.]
MKNTSSHSSIKKSLFLIILWGLILEYPFRYFVSPDPWIHSSSNWYFDQPDRVLVELGFVLLALLPFFWVKELKNLLIIKWTKNNLLFLSFGVLGSIIVFGLQQWEEIEIIQQKNLGQYVPLWLLTGLVVGFAQELTFRGLIYTGIFKKYGIKTAVVISTLCFALGSIHSVRLYAYFINDYILEALLLLVIFILAGLFFVWVRIKTNNIIIPAIIHGVGNAVTWSTFVVVKLYV